MFHIGPKEFSPENHSKSLTFSRNSKTKETKHCKSLLEYRLFDLFHYYLCIKTNKIIFKLVLGLQTFTKIFWCWKLDDQEKTIH